MNLFYLLKYGSVASIPIFAFIALFLIKRFDGYSVKKYTVSESAKFIDNPIYLLVFRCNFFLKGMLDLGFAVYVLNNFHLSVLSPPVLMLILSAILFGSLGYFIEGEYRVLHAIIVYISGSLWVGGQIFLSSLVGSSNFFFFTLIILLIPVVIGFGFLFARRTNAVVQSVCVGFLYIWLLIFVFWYL